MSPHDDAAKTILLLLVVLDSCAGLPLYEDQLDSKKPNSSSSESDGPSTSLFRFDEPLYPPSSSKHNSYKKRVVAGRIPVVEGEPGRKKSGTRMHVKEQLLSADAEVFSTASLKRKAKQLPLSHYYLGASMSTSHPLAIYADSFNVGEDPELDAGNPSLFDAVNPEAGSRDAQARHSLDEETHVVTAGSTNRDEPVISRQTFIYSNHREASLRNKSDLQIGVFKYYPKSRRHVRRNDIPSPRRTAGSIKGSFVPRGWRSPESSFSGALNVKRPSLFDAILDGEKVSQEDTKKAQIPQDTSNIWAHQTPTNSRTDEKIVSVNGKINVTPCEDKTSKLLYNFGRISDTPAPALSHLPSEERKSGSLIGKTVRPFSTSATYSPQRVDVLRDHLPSSSQPAKLELGAQESGCRSIDGVLNEIPDAGDKDDNTKSLFDEVLAQMVQSPSGGAGTSEAVPGPATTGATQQTIQIQQTQVQQNPVLDSEVIPGLLQGDIAVDASSDEAFMRVGVNWDVFPEKRWENGTVPYVVSPLYSPEELQLITTAIRTLNFLTCVRFVPWDGLARDYIAVQPVPEPHGCWSYVGRRGGQQVVGLQPADHRSKRCFASVGKPLHELMHVLGVHHEHTRADRDLYISVLLHNLLPDAEKNFEKLSLVNTAYAFEYDYDSVMHYGESYFSKDGVSPTIRPLVAGVRIGQRDMLSKKDCLKLNAMYGCTARGHPQREMYTVFCNALTL